MLGTLDSTALKAKLFRGLADPTRLALLEVLMGGEKSVGELAAAADNTVANVSAHLACLTGCGLARSDRRGTYVYYRLQERRVRDLRRIADSIQANAFRQVYECTHTER